MNFNNNIIPNYNFQQPTYPQPAWGQQPQQQMGNTIKPCLKSLPVTSIDEARASLIDLDGSMYVFVNMAQGEIYTKQYNFSTGRADFNIYSSKSENSFDSYVSKDEFKDFIAKFDRLNRDFEKMKGAGVNGKPNAVNANISDGKK